MERSFLGNIMIIITNRPVNKKQRANEISLKNKEDFQTQEKHRFIVSIFRFSLFSLRVACILIKVFE